MINKTQVLKAWEESLDIVAYDELNDHHLISLIEMVEDNVRDKILSMMNDGIFQHSREEYLKSFNERIQDKYVCEVIRKLKKKIKEHNKI